MYVGYFPYRLPLSSCSFTLGNEITDHNCLGAPHPLADRRDDNAIMCPTVSVRYLYLRFA